jgi:hypothetical protein
VISAAEPASRGKVVESITGSGHFTTAWPAVIPDQWRTFSMNARKYADGSVDGSYQMVTHATSGENTKAHGVITCFTVIGDKAWVGGYQPSAPAPNDVVWQVVDNGQGVNSTPDQMGLQIVASTFGMEPGLTDYFCSETPEVLVFPGLGPMPLFMALFDVESGNVQVKVK